MLEAANAVVPKITPEQAADMIAKGDALILDVRDASEVAASDKKSVAACWLRRIAFCTDELAVQTFSTGA
jgi:hypothetical protein